MGAGGDRQATWLGARMESVKRGNDGDPYYSDTSPYRY